MYLPGYSPELQPAEHLWPVLDEPLANRYFATLADVVLVDLGHPDMMPVRDPLRSLVFHAADRAVKDVYVAGRKIVSDGGVTTLDHRGAGERLSAAQQRMMASSVDRDYRGRTTEELAPLSLPVM